MSEWDLSEDERDEILRRDILPTYFPGEAASVDPTLVLLAGHPGAGKSRAQTQLIAEHADDLAVISGDDLRAFLPDYLEFTSTRSPRDPQALAGATVGWVRDCIRFARENRRSLLLEGSFRDPAVVAGTAARFAAEGFATRIVVVASRRAESLLSVTSRYLRDVHTGVPARLVSREAHDLGLDDTATLVAALEANTAVDRLTILDRPGHAVFDARAVDDTAFGGASTALRAALTARLSRLDATQWLSELHHVAAFAEARADLPGEVTELLIDLHEAALREVIPELHVPDGGKFATAVERTTVANLVTLRRSLPPAPVPIDAAFPVVVPGGPERGGPSR